MTFGILQQPAVVLINSDIPLIRGFAEVRHHRLEVWIFRLFTFQRVEQGLSMIRQTLPQQVSVHSLLLRD